MLARVLDLHLRGSSYTGGMSDNSNAAGAKTGWRAGHWLVLLVLLGGALGVLCHEAFLPRPGDVEQ